MTIINCKWLLGHRRRWKGWNLELQLLMPSVFISLLPTACSCWLSQRMNDLPAMNYACLSSRRAIHQVIKSSKSIAPRELPNECEILSCFLAHVTDFSLLLVQAPQHHNWAWTSLTCWCGYLFSDINIFCFKGWKVRWCQNSNNSHFPQRKGKHSLSLTTNISKPPM